MKKIDKIILENFKFFRGEEVLDFNSKNILIYGENGSGKSSLYWGLYTFLQSSLKDDASIKKYFDKQHKERLINRFANDNDNSSLKLTLKNNENITSTYEISFDSINTNKTDTEIRKANMASDFINYRLLSKLYHFKNSEDIELFSMFEDEILTYITIENENFDEIWKTLKAGLNPRPKMTDQAYKDFQDKLIFFNTKFEIFLQNINRKANDILKDNFNEQIKIFIDYENATYDDFIDGSTTKRNHITIAPKINLHIEFSNDNHKVDKPHTFLNEARLTAIALSLRFAILKQRLSVDSILKILVLDDLLISLDMTHRVEVINFILEDEDLEDYQLIVLTHDKGFFQLLQQKISPNNWKKFEFYNQNEKQCIKESKNNLEKAKELFENKDYEASSNYLRKETERILKHFLDPNLKCINKEFNSLENLLNQVKNELDNEYRKDFNKIFKNKNLDKDLLNKIDSDFENDGSLTPHEKGLLRGAKTKLLKFTKKYHEYKVNELIIFDELKNIKDRVLNPSSHSSEAPIFRREVEDAIKLVERLKNYLQEKETQNSRCVRISHCNESQNAENVISNFVPLLIDFETDILSKLILINETEILNQFLQNEIMNNIEHLQLNEIEKIFDELRLREKVNLLNISSEANLIRIFNKKDWSLEEKKVWCSFIQYLFNQNKIQDPFLVQKLEEKNALKRSWGGLNNQEEYIECEIDNDIRSK